jgi:tripeptide aminopeptidase
MQDVTIDDKAYIMATLPNNVTHEVPTIGFRFSFYYPDFTGANVKPQIITNYDGHCIECGKHYFVTKLFQRFNTGKL